MSLRPRWWTLVLAVLTLAGSSNGLGRTHPDFSGHWTIDEAASNLDGAGGWFGGEVHITQDAKKITFASGGTGPGTGSSTYTLDGVTTTRTVGRGSRSEKAEWKGDQLVVTTTFSATDVRTVSVSLDKGGAMVVDVTSKPAGTGHFARHSVYRKSPHF